MLLAFTGSESHSFRGSTGLAILIPAYATYLIVVVFRVWNILTMYGTSQNERPAKLRIIVQHLSAATAVSLKFKTIKL